MRRKVSARLDGCEMLPSGMREYIMLYGWHFSKNLCEFAVSRMKGRDGECLAMSRDDIERMLREHGVVVSPEGYDHVFVTALLKSLYYGSSITDEHQLALAVGDYLGNAGYGEVALTRYYADCIGKGTVICWEDML